MTGLPRRHWRKRLARFGMSRRPASFPTRRRTRLDLEALEARWVPSTVSNLNDAGPGSLRQAILDTPAGGTVDFQPGLTGTIVLTSGEMDIVKDLTIAGPGASVLAVSGGRHSQVFRDADDRGSVTISALTIADGYDEHVVDGGGMTSGGALTVSNCIFSGNSAAFDGGGIFNDGNLTVINSIFTGNSAGRYGGGIANDGAVTVINSIFRDNSTTGGFFSAGGGIDNNPGTLTVMNSTFSGNSTGGVGGGIVTAYGTATVLNSTFSGNSAGSAGGGLFNNGVLTLSNSTFSGNSASGGGGVADQVDGPQMIRDNLIAGNTAPTAPDVRGPLNSQGHNLIGDGTGGSGYDPTDLVGTAAHPINPRLGPLADNGGPTPTMAPLPGSPALDAGDNAFSPGPYDQRGPGFPRIVNGVIDIGAFESQVVAPTVSCSVADPLLWPPNHRLVNVGLGVAVDPPDADLQIVVYSNDHASPADAADIAPGTLRLRGERQGNGDGRVYLIVVTAANAGGTSFDVCAVAVPHDHSPRSIASVQQQAAAAEAYYRENQTAPPGYDLLGEGPDSGGARSPGQAGQHVLPGDLLRALSPSAATSPTPLGSASVTAAAFPPADEMRAAWAALSADRYFATASDEAFLAAHPAPAWPEAVTGAALDLLPSDDQLLV